MNQLPFKAVAVDMDGTFLDDKKQYNKTLFRALLDKMNKLGISFIVSSGNQLATLEEYFTETRNEIAFVAENGSYIVNQGKTIHHDNLNPDDINAILAFFAKYPEVHPILCGIKSAYILADEPESFKQHAAFYHKKLQIVKDFNQLSDDIFLMLTCKLPDEETLQFTDLVNQKFNKIIYATSGGNGFIDFIHPETNKAAGLEKLLNSMDLTLKDLIAFGDGGNDVEMLNAAGLSYAMENGQAVAKKAADKIAPNNNDDGVLRVLAEYLL